MLMAAQVIVILRVARLVFFLAVTVSKLSSIWVTKLHRVVPMQTYIM